jgi:uncharacterized lipoprotein YajG
MKYMMMLLVVMLVAGCAGTSQCMAPTEREAKITKRVWM